MSGEQAKCLVLLGAFGIGNYGNDATLDASIAGVRSAAHRAAVDIDLRCVCSDVEFVRARTGLPSSSLHESGSHPRGPSSRFAVVRIAGAALRTLERLVGAIRHLRGVDRLCVAGTGTLDDQHIRPWGLPFDVAMWSIAARLTRTDLVFVSVGAGPINHRLSRVFYRIAARCAREVSYRDQRSKDYMSSISRDVSEDTVTPDLVFGRSGGPPVSSLSNARPCVAVGVLWSGHWATMTERANYFDRLEAVIHGLWHAGFDVVLIEGDVHDRQDVAELAGRLLNTDVGAPDRLKVPEIRSFDDVLGEVAICAATVASRYHHLVAAFLSGRPAVSLEYGPKNAAVMEDLGLDAFCHSIDDFVPDEVVAQVRQLAHDSRVTDRIRKRVSVMRALVDAQWDGVVR